MRAFRVSHQPRHRASSWRRVLAAPTAGLLVALTGLAGLGAQVLSASPAQAAPAGAITPGVEVSGVTAFGTIWLGAMASPTGLSDVAWCIEAGADAPAGSTPDSSSIVSDAALAWIVGTYEGVADANYRAAISYLVHMRHEIGSNGVTAATRTARLQANTPTAVKNLASAMLTNAGDGAGPYVGGTTTSSTTTGGRTGTIQNIQLLSANGSRVGGKTFTATLSGPAAFDATGTDTYTGVTSAAGPITLTWHATGNGTVTFRISYGDLGRVTLTRFSNGAVQDVLTYGNRSAADPSETSSPPITFEGSLDFQPTASSAVGSKVVSRGDPLVDTLTVGVAPGDAWLDAVPVTFVGTAYSTGSMPATTSPTAPADATVLGSTNLTVTGPGTYSAQVPGVSDGQVVTWVWRMTKSEQTTAAQLVLRGDWSDSFGLPAETTSVRHPAAATSSVVTIDDDGDGRIDGLADDVTLTGFPADHSSFAGGAGLVADVAEVVQTLTFFPAGVEVSEANLAQAWDLGTVTLPAVNGTYSSVGAGNFQLPRTSTGGGMPGTYVFTHSFVGDDRVEPFTTSVTDTAEQFVLAERPMSVTTTAQADRTVVLGDQATVWDTATVTGDIPVGATITWDLYQWAGDEPDCTGTPIWTSAPVELMGEGEIVSPTTLVDPIGGSLGFVATVRQPDEVIIFSLPEVGDHDDAGTVLSVGVCGEQAETLAAGDFTVTTTAAADRKPVFGDYVTVHDVAQVTGTVPDDATITWELYTWPTGTEPICDTPIRTSQPQTLAVGEVTSEDYLVDPVRGDLGFVEVVLGADGRELHRGTCGAASETLIDDDLTVTTTAMAGGSLRLGASGEVWDEALVVGEPAAGTTIRFELYTWPTGGEPTCTAAIWTSPELAVSGAGTVVSPHARLASVPGTLGFVEVVSGADGRVLHRGVCGAAAETLAPLPRLALTGFAPAWSAAVAAVLLVVGSGLVIFARRARASSVRT